jgi:DNA replication protein DnaC
LSRSIFIFDENGMEQFLTTFSQHVTSFLNLKAMKWVDTGDRMMDTTIQMMISTLTAALVTFILTIYKNKGLLQDLLQKVNVLLKRAEPNPLLFDPALADGKPKNGKAFLCSINLIASNIKKGFIRWFMINHSKKFMYLENQESSLMIYHVNTTCSLHKDIEKDVAWKIHKDTYVPVWKDKNGYWVYLNTYGNDIQSEIHLKSDSYEALENCLASINEFTKKITEEQEKVVYTGSILEFDTKGQPTLIGDVSKNKTFDSLFFEQKEKVLPILKLFKENKLYPSHIPIDNKIGILLHGPPGTGKTAFISALANYLCRNIVLVDMSKIKTQTQWNNIFRNTNTKRSIFVFEEFDCMPCIQRRDKGEKKEIIDDDVLNGNPQLMMMMAMQNKDSKVAEDYKKEMDEKREILDLGFVLRKLDGIENVNDRIIVATTNHPEKIDPALLRPGRFGIHIHLKNANHKVLCDMLNMIYKANVTEDDVYDVEEYLWSPAEILQNSLQYISVNEYIDFLRRGKPCGNDVV